MAKRHNIDTIAEVLIDKLNDMERTASRIEKASQRELKLDVSELGKLMEERKGEENRILEGLRALKGKNRGRLPNWALATVLLSLLFSTVLSIYAWKKAEAYDLQRARAEHYERLYLELGKEKK